MINSMQINTNEEVLTSFKMQVTNEIEFVNQKPISNVIVTNFIQLKTELLKYKNVPKKMLRNLF